MHTSIIHWELSQFVLAARHGSKSYRYLDFDKIMMGCQIVTEGAMYFGYQIFEWQIPWYFCLYHAICLSAWLKMQPVSGQLELHAAF
jgi:hypothetical protein